MTLATLWTVAWQALLPMNSPGKNPGVSCHFLLQGIFPTQGSNSRSPALQVGSLPTESPEKPAKKLYKYVHKTGLPKWLSGKESTCNAGDAGDVALIPGSGRPLGGERGKPVQYYHQENSMDREAWWPAVHGVTKNWYQTQLEQLSTICK